MHIKQFLKKLYYVPSSTLNTSAKKNTLRMNVLMKEFKNPILLNIGSGDRFIGKESFESTKKIVNLDISFCSSLDVLSDAHRLPFKKDTFQGIVCQAVLEHTRNPEEIIKEMYRVLKKGGIIYTEVPFLQGFHPDPVDYYRYTLAGINNILSEFSHIDSGVCVGPSSTLCWILREYLSGVFTCFSSKRFVQSVANLFFGWLTFPIKFLDLIFANRPGAHKIASGLYFLGRKN